MSLAASLFLVIVLILLISMLFGLMFSYYFLLKHFAAKFPAYYTSLGMPFIPATDGTIRKTIARDRYNYRLLGKLLMGRPADFPDDATARRLATYVRLELLASLVLIGMTVGATTGL